LQCKLRWVSSARPLFPFGFGLSYTTYAYSEFKTTSDNGLTVTFKVKNTGKRAGEETAQVYLTLPASTHEPPRRLVGWSKIALGPGEQKDVTVKVEPQMVSVFNPDKNLWEVVLANMRFVLADRHVTCR
jgi:beta-glucosidase